MSQAQDTIAVSHQHSGTFQATGTGRSSFKGFQPFECTSYPSFRSHSSQYPTPRTKVLEGLPSGPSLRPIGVRHSNETSVTNFAQDVEKGSNRSSRDVLAEYIVPVLDKGAKSALTRPVSRWTKFRVWYNPYRQVSVSLKADRCASIAQMAAASSLRPS